MDYTIRLERTNEQRETENVVREAFWNVYRPGCTEHYILNQLRIDEDFIAQLNFVIEVKGRVIGQSMFMKSIIKTENEDIPVITLGPISIAPEFQKMGFGKILLDYSLNRAKELNYGAVFLEGDINFYKHSGFVYASSYGIGYGDVQEDVQENENSPFFLCKELIDGYLDGVKGNYIVPSGYFVSEEDAEEFDREFPYKEKLKLPEQLFD